MYYVYIWKDSGACRPVITRNALRREEVPADVSVRAIHCAPEENEALDVFRALLEYMPESGLWSAVEGDSLTRTVSWDGPPLAASIQPQAENQPGWAESLWQLLG